MATECARIIANLKAALRARAITYAELGRRVGLSEASIKRILSRGALSVQRLERICDAIGIGIADVVQHGRGTVTDTPRTLTLEQETRLAAEPHLLSCFHLLASGRTSAEIAAETRTSARKVQQWLVQLKQLGLTTQTPGMRGRPSAVAGVKWRPNGPVRRMYDREVRAEFLQSLFVSEGEALHFRFAELSDASCRVLTRKLDRLAAEFADLADLDRSLPAARKRNTGFLLAMRPWVSTRFRKLTQARQV